MSSFFFFFEEMGKMFLFVRLLFRCASCTVQRNKGLLLEQLATVGLRSLSTVCFSGFFVGAILVIQFQLMLAQYEATSMLGGLNTSSCVREVGPLIISFLLAGKVGAYTTAELGTMKVTEQIDAIRCLGKDPVEYLIVPRFLAIIFCSVLLLVFGLVVSTFGSMLVASLVYNINPLQYMQSIPRFTSFWTVFSGIFKSFVYGFIVATVSTYMGYTTTGGAKGVGRAVTNCAVYTNLFIVLANSFTGLLLRGVENILWS